MRDFRKSSMWLDGLVCQDPPPEMRVLMGGIKKQKLVTEVVILAVAAFMTLNLTVIL